MPVKCQKLILIYPHSLVQLIYYELIVNVLTINGMQLSILDRIQLRICLSSAAQSKQSSKFSLLIQIQPIHPMIQTNLLEVILLNKQFHFCIKLLSIDKILKYFDFLYFLKMQLTIKAINLGSFVINQKLYLSKPAIHKFKYLFVNLS